MPETTLTLSTQFLVTYVPILYRHNTRYHHLLNQVVGVANTGTIIRFTTEKTGKKFILNVGECVPDALFTRTLHAPLPHFLAQVCWSCDSPAR